MNKVIILISITGTLLLSCMSDNINTVLKTSKNPELDMVFHSVVKAELKQSSDLIKIIDKATEKKSYGIVEFDTIKRNKNNNIYWNKNIFPKINYISQKTLDLKLKNEKAYWEFAKENKQGWIKISEPIFTSNKKRVIVFVEFLNPDRKFGCETYYILEKNENTYQIVKQEIVSIS